MTLPKKHRKGKSPGGHPPSREYLLRESLPAADKLQQFKRVAVLQGGFGKRPGGHDVRVPLHHDFFGRQPTPEDKVEQRRPLAAYGDLAVYGDIHERLVRLAINQKTPVTRDGRFMIRHDDASLRQYQLHQVPRVWDEPTLSL